MAVSAYAPTCDLLSSGQPATVEPIGDFFTTALPSGRCVRLVERKPLILAAAVEFSKSEVAVWSEGAVIAWNFGPRPVPGEFLPAAQT